MITRALRCWSQRLGDEPRHAHFKRLKDRLFLDIETVDASVATLARYDFGALIALQDLSPLYVSGTTAAAREKLAEIWQAGRASDYAAWLTDKTAAAPSTFTDSFSKLRKTGEFLS